MSKFNDSLLSLKFRTLFSEYRAESAALWLLCFYIFIEYIRPHGMYPALDIIPWGQVSIIACLLGVFMTNNKAIGFGSMDMMFVLMSLIVILSAIFAWNTEVSLKYWSTYTSWILMYFCIVSILTSSNRMWLFVIFLLLINFKLSEHGARSFAMRGFSFAHWGLSGPPGWFRNSGEFSMQMVVVFSISLNVLLASKKYIDNMIRWRVLMVLFPGTALLSVIGSSSRGGQMALAAVILILFMKGKYFFRKVVVLAILVYIGMAVLPPEQIERFYTMGEDKTSQLRLTHWENALQVINDNPLGIGYYNWAHYYYAHFDIDKVEEIHNTVLQAFVELGYPGGILFLVMVFLAFSMNARTTREMKGIARPEAEAMAAVARGLNYGLLGTLIASLFMSVLFYPIFWLAFALTSAIRHISAKMLEETASLGRDKNWRNNGKRSDAFQGKTRGLRS